MYSTADGEPEDFDATLLAVLDPECFEFGDARAGYPRVRPLRLVVEDVDGDGDLDLLLHFSMREIIESAALDTDTVDVVLTAEFGGAAIGFDLVGYNALDIVQPKGKDKKDK